MPFNQESTGSGRDAFAFSAHATNEVTRNRGFWVGTGGDITLRSVDGAADVVLKNVASGTFIDLAVKYLRVTGTTAADFVGFA